MEIKMRVQDEKSPTPTMEVFISLEDTLDLTLFRHLFSAPAVGPVIQKTAEDFGLAEPPTSLVKIRDAFVAMSNVELPPLEDGRPKLKEENLIYDIAVGKEANEAAKNHSLFKKIGFIASKDPEALRDILNQSISESCYTDEERRVGGLAIEELITIAKKINAGMAEKREPTEKDKEEMTTHFARTRELLDQLRALRNQHLN